MDNAPFWGPGTTPIQATWPSMPENSPAGTSGHVLIFILGSELRFGQRCEEQLYFFGDTVYSAWRVWRLSPSQFNLGNLSFVPFGRYWWPMMPWCGRFEDLPEGTLINMLHQNMTPDEYNQQDPAYRAHNCPPVPEETPNSHMYRCMCPWWP